MASIKKRANGTFQATIYVGRDTKGKQIFRYITKPTEKEAKAAARKLEQELAEGKITDLGKMRLVAWMAEWIELNASRLAPPTVRAYKTYLKVHYAPYFGNIRLEKLTELHIRRFIADKLKELSSTTVRKLVLVLKRVLYDALKNGSPAKDISPPPPAEYTVHLLTDQELEQIRRVVSGTADEAIVLLAAWGGLRRGEIFALKWDDVMWDEGRIRIDETKHINDADGFQFGPPKSRNGFRQVAIPEYLVQLLREIRKRQHPLGSTIFDCNPNVYSTYWMNLVRKKELPKVRFHDLRHYHASWLYSNDIPDQYAARRMGHDIQTLKTVYQHIDRERNNQIDDNIRRLQQNRAQQSAQQNITNGSNSM